MPQCGHRRIISPWSDVEVKKFLDKVYAKQNKIQIPQILLFKMKEQECASCHEPLVLDIEPDSDDEDSKAPAVSQSIPDDVELKQCGCHFHWECFLEAYSITQCPNCSKDISSLSADGQQQVRWIY
jgi:hypothetical protein